MSRIINFNLYFLSYKISNPYQKAFASRQTNKKFCYFLPLNVNIDKSLQGRDESWIFFFNSLKIVFCVEKFMAATLKAWKNQKQNIFQNSLEVFQALKILSNFRHKTAYEESPSLTFFDPMRDGSHVMTTKLNSVKKAKLCFLY